MTESSAARGRARPIADIRAPPPRGKSGAPPRSRSHRRRPSGDPEPLESLGLPYQISSNAAAPTALHGQPRKAFNRNEFRPAGGDVQGPPDVPFGIMQQHCSMMVASAVYVIMDFDRLFHVLADSTPQRLIDKLPPRDGQTL